MAITGDDKPLIQMRPVRGTDVLAVAEAAEEGERGVEDEGPKEQHTLYRAEINRRWRRWFEKPT